MLTTSGGSPQVTAEIKRTVLLLLHNRFIHSIFQLYPYHIQLLRSTIKNLVRITVGWVGGAVTHCFLQTLHNICLHSENSIWLIKNHTTVIAKEVLTQ